MPQVRIIPPSESLIDAVASVLHGEGPDWSRSVVVFHGRRPAHFLRKRLAERAGSGIRPPRIFSWEMFMTFLCEERLQIPARVLEPVDAVHFLFGVHQNIGERFGGEEFRSLDRFLPLGLKLFGELEELHAAGLTPAEVHEKIGGITYGNLHAVAGYYEQFYAELARAGFTTPAGQNRVIAGRIGDVDLSDFRDVVLAGLYALRPVNRSIVKGLKERDNVRLIFQQGKNLYAQLYELGIEGEELPPPEDPLTKYSFCRSSDTHGQVFALSRVLRDVLDAGVPADERTAIVLLSPETLFPLLHQALARLPEHAYNISLRYPLSRTPVYGFLLNLVRLGTSARDGKVRVSDYMNFVLHPYTKNIRFGGRTEVTRVLFHALESELTRKNLRPAIGLDEIEAMPGVMERTLRGLEGEEADAARTRLRDHLKEIHDRTIRRFLTIESFRDFAEKCIEALVYISEASTADLHPNFHPSVRALIESLRTLRTSLMGGRRFDDVQSYARLLAEYIGGADVAFPGTPLGGMQVLGLLETRNLSFDRVFLLDASDDALPGSAGQGMLLPQRLRESLGLETYRVREAAAEYHFDLLRHGAGEVRIFYVEDGKREKSRFVEKLIWRMEQETGQVGADAFVQNVGYAVRLTNPAPEAVPKDASLERQLAKLELSASSLDCYLACQLRFYYRYVLRLAEREEVSEELGAMDVGTLVHRVLKAFFADAVGRRLSAGDLTPEKLRSAVERVFRESFAGDVSGSAYLVRVQVQRQLEKFLERYQRPMAERERVEITGLEQTVSIVRDGIGFEGRVDRMERRGDSLSILDYKTGTDGSRYRIDLKELDPAVRESWEGSIGSLQLPLYMMLCAGRFEVPLGNLRPSYIILGSVELSEDIEQGLGDGEHTAAEVYARVEPVILGLANEIRDRNIPFRPPADLKKNCPGCAFASLCGTKWTTVGDEW